MLHYTLVRVSRLLRFPEPTLPERPPRIYSEWFRVIWRPDSVDYAVEPGQHNERFLYGLIACGGESRWIADHLPLRYAFRPFQARAPVLVQPS